MPDVFDGFSELQSVFRSYPVSSSLCLGLTVSAAVCVSCVQVSPCQQQFVAVIFDDCCASLKRFMHQCHEAMMVDGHHWRKQAGESKLKFQVSAGSWGGHGRSVSRSDDGGWTSRAQAGGREQTQVSGQCRVMGRSREVSVTQR